LYDFKHDIQLQALKLHQENHVVCISSYFTYRIFIETIKHNNYMKIKLTVLMQSVKFGGGALGFPLPKIRFIFSVFLYLLDK